MVVAAGDNDASRIQRLKELVNKQGVQLAPEWRSQISKAPSGTWRLAAVSPVDNLEQKRSAYALSTDTATIPITCNGEPGDFHMDVCKVECSCPSCSIDEAPAVFWSRMGSAGFQKHSGLAMNGSWRQTFLVDVPEFVGKTLEEYLQLHGYCFGSKPGRLPWQSTAARPAASETVSSVHSEYEPDSPPNPGGVSSLVQANSITAEGHSRPTKRRCTRLTRRSTGAVPAPSLSRPAVQDKQALDDTSSVRGTSESQNGNAKAAPATEKAHMSSAPETPQALSATADGMRLRQQEIQIKSLRGDVDKQAEELDLYKQLMRDCQQEITQKDHLIKAKDEQLADLRAQQQEQARLMVDAQQALKFKEQLLGSIISNQAGASTGHDHSKWVSHDTHERCLAAVHAKAQEALSSALQRCNAESHKCLELQLQLAAREAVYGAEESLVVRSGLSKTQVALKASTKLHQQVLLERDQLQSQLQQEKQKTAAEQNKSQRLAKSLNDKGVEAQRLRKELVQANRHVFSRESFESDIAILTSKAEALQKTLQDAESSHGDESSKELADAWADKDRLAADLEEEQALHTAAKYEIQQLKAAGDSAAQQLKGQAQELQASSDQLHNQLNQRPAPKDFERLTQQTEQLRQNVLDLESEKDQLQQKVDASEAGRRQLQQQLNSTESSHEDMTVLKEKLATAEDEAANAKDNWEARVEALEAELTQTQGTLAAAQDSCSSFEERLSSEQSALQQLQQQYNEACSSRQDLELKLGDLQSQLDAKANEAHALQQSLFNAQAELKDQEVLLQDCHAGTQQAENKREELQQEVRRLVGELTTAQATSAAAGLCEDLQKEIVECKDELVAMQQDLTEWPHAWGSFQPRTSQVRAAMAAVNDRLKVEVTEVQSELAEVKAEATRSAAKAKAQRQNAHIADRERLQEDLKEMVSDRKDAEERAARLQQELQETKAEVKQLEADTQEAVHARDQAQELAKKLQKELKGERAKNKRLQADLETTTQDRDDLKDEVQRKLGQNATLERDLAEAIIESAALQKQLHQLELQVGPHYPNSTPLGSPGSSDELAMSHGRETRSVPNTPSRANLSRSFDAAVHSGNPDAPLEPPLNSLRDTTPPNSTHSTAASSLNRAQQPPAGPPVVPHELPQNDFKSDFAVADDEVTADASIDAAPADVREAANAELHNAAHTVSEHDPEVQHTPGVLDEGSSDVRMGASAESSPEHAGGVQTPWHVLE
ncbi:hypothetical protein WJX82_006630 [Trebouxia sp. C0006]